MISRTSPPGERRPPDPESFIPLSRRQLVERLLADDGCEAFRRFCEIFAALIHHQLHGEVEEFEADYASVSPDATTGIVPSPAVDVKDAGGRVADLFRRMVLRANYREITTAELKRHCYEKSRTRGVLLTIARATYHMGILVGGGANAMSDLLTF